MAVKPHRINRVLRLVKPSMKGPDIRDVQAKLGVKVDGHYGPETGSHAAAWKYRAGFPRRRINTGLGEWAQHLLLNTGHVRLPITYRARAVARKRAGYTPGRGEAYVDRGLEALRIMRGWADRRLVESPPGSNRVPRLMALGGAHNVPSAGMGYPWCAYAVFLAYVMAGSKAARAGLVEQRFNALYTPEILDVARRGEHGMTVVSFDRAEPGDLVLFNFDGGVVDHIGILDTKLSRTMIRTVEGNTSFDQYGSQDNGGAMAVRDRDMDLVTAFVRIP